MQQFKFPNDGLQNQLLTTKFNSNSNNNNSSCNTSNNGSKKSSNNTNNLQRLSLGTLNTSIKIEFVGKKSMC